MAACDVTSDDTASDAPREIASDVASDDIHAVATSEPPLHTAIRKKNVNVIHQLIEQGADLELEDYESGDTALGVAVSCKNLEAAKVLLEHGANVNQKRWKPLHADFCEENTSRSRGATPLCVALFHMQLDMVKLLLSHGALVNIYTDDERTIPTRICVCSLAVPPLKVASFGWWNTMEEHYFESKPHSARLVDCREIIKLLLPLCDDFDLVRDMTQRDSESNDSSCDEADDTGIPKNGFISCIQMFSYGEIRCGARSLELTTLMLQHGATAGFDRLYRWSSSYELNFLEAVSESFIKLAVLSGCCFAKFRRKVPEFARIVREQEPLLRELKPPELEEQSLQLPEQRLQQLELYLQQLEQYLQQLEPMLQLLEQCLQLPEQHLQLLQEPLQLPELHLQLLQQRLQLLRQRLQPVRQRLQLFEPRLQLLQTMSGIIFNPLSLQELSIMTIRSSFGGRRIWTKVDALPKGVPRHVKDMIKLKTW